MDSNSLNSNIEEKARTRWNQNADKYNQWPTLGQDEKDSLIEVEKSLLEEKGLIPHEIVVRHLLKNVSLIQCWREHLKLSQTDLSEKTGISLERLTDIESGKNPANSKELELLSCSMNLSNDQLSSKEEDNKIEHSVKANENIPLVVLNRNLCDDVPMTKCWREHLGLDLDFLAQKSGIDISRISKIESGSSAPSSQELRQLAQAMNLSFEQLSEN
jgi:transcriptional regulator with XRE-family HTH domain